MRHCIKCRNIIAKNRLEALPHTKVCIACSAEIPVKGFMTWEHKTAPTFQIVTADQHVWLQQHDRKRPSASLPMSSKSTGVQLTSSYTSVPQNRPINVGSEASDLSLVPRARCGHSDRPQVGPSGKCVECAVAYYALRAKYASK